MTDAPVKKAHLATVTPETVPTNALQVLEATTGSVCSAVAAAIAAAPSPAGLFRVPVQLPDGSRETIAVTIRPGPRPVNAPALQRVRRQFTALKKQAGFGRVDADAAVDTGGRAVAPAAIAHEFAHYVASSL